MQSLPLESFWQSQGASWQEERGWKIPASLKLAEAAQYQALAQTCALTDQSHRGKIRVTGSERVSFLNRMLTNDLQAVSTGTGQRTFLLSAQGKCLADFRAFITKESLLLDTEPGLAEEAIRLLDKFIIADDVQLEDITSQTVHLSIDGPQSGTLRTELTRLLPSAAVFSLPGHASLSGCSSLHLWVPAEPIEPFIEMLKSLTIPFCSPVVFNQFRLERKVPRFKIDFDESWFLNETGLEETAASETKGCYPGQEVVARIKTYKKVERRLFT